MVEMGAIALPLLVYWWLVQLGYRLAEWIERHGRQ